MMAVLLVNPGRVFAQCGVERWSVKTGTDADVGSINLSTSSSISIATMRSWTAPSPIPANNRVSPQETTVWVLNATLTQYKAEGDSDYHLVLSDSSGRTLIGEIPSPSCVSSSSRFRTGIQNARSQFDAVLTATGSFKTANVPVRIMGVGMFDFLHGQTGVAPNGIEIHPILDIVFNPGNTSDFSLSASPSSVSAVTGGSTSTSISGSLSGSFNSAIALSASGVPSGTSVSFSPSSIPAPGSGSATMNIAVGSSTAAGSYTLTVTGSGGGRTHTTPVTLTVSNSGGGSQLLGNPGFESGSTVWTATAAVIDNSSGEPPHAGSWKAWLDGYGSAHTDTLMQQVTIPSSATSATLAFWLHIDTAETTTTTAFDTLKVQIRNSSGTVLSTLATYSNLDAASGYTRQSFDLTSFKGSTIQVFLIGVEGSVVQTSFVVDDFALNVQ
jgi:hypothetical protein